MRPLLNLIYILFGIFGLVRIPRLLLRKKMRKSKAIAEFDTRMFYLVIRDIHTGDMYVIRDIYADWDTFFDLTHVVNEENSKLYLACCPTARVMVSKISDDLILESNFHIVKMVDVPNKVMRLVTLEWLTSAICVNADLFGYEYHRPSYAEQKAHGFSRGMIGNLANRENFL